MADRNIHYRPQGPVQHEEPETHEQTEKKSKRPPVPDWFENKPFQYNSRMMVSFLPGACLVLYLGGEMLLAVLTIGAFVIHILDSSGEKRSAVVASLITFFCSQMLVFYSAVPLLWRSLLNILIIMLLNMFTILTGGWVLLQFSIFRQEEPELIKMAETFLFALYPMVTTGLITWMVTNVTSIQLAPISFTIAGFILLQLFLTPSLSSFVKSSHVKQGEGVILQPEIKVVVLLAYITLPVMLMFCVLVHRLRWEVIQFDTVIQLFFIFSMTVFLVTFLAIRECVELFGAPYIYLTKVRWMSGFSTLITLNAVLRHLPGLVHLLPVLPVGLGLYTALALAINHRKRQGVWVAFAVLILFYGYIFFSAPWMLDYTLPYMGLHIKTLLIFLFLNATLSVLVLTCPADVGSDTLGMILTSQTLGFVLLEVCLQKSGLYNVLLMLFSSFLGIYLVLKLFHVHKLPWPPTWLILSMQSMKVPSFYSLLIQNTDSSLVLDGTEIICIFSLTAVVLKLFLFEKEEEMSNKKALFYFVTIGTSVICCVALFMSVYIVRVLHEEAHLTSTELGLIFLIWSLIYLKITLGHKVEDLIINQLSWILLAISASMILVQPVELSLTGYAVLKWITVILMTTGFITVISRPVLNTHLAAMVTAATLGIPAGVVIQQVNPVNSAVEFITISLASWMCSYMLLVVWKKLRNLQIAITISFFVMQFLIVVNIISNLASHDFGDVIKKSSLVHGVSLDFSTPCLLYAAGINLITAAILKYHAHKNEPPDLLSNVPSKNSILPSLGNLSASLGFVFLWMAKPESDWEIWVCSSSLCLFLLQKDSVILRKHNPHNQEVPTIVVCLATLAISTVTNSNFFLPRQTIWTQIQSVMELVVVVLTIPAYVASVAFLWTGKMPVSEQMITFFWPLYSLLFIFGSSYQAWVLAAVGLGTGVWAFKQFIRQMRTSNLLN